MNNTEVMIHESAIVSEQTKIGSGTKIWVNSQIRENAIIGENCIIGKDTYVDEGVIIGDNVKIQNGVSVYKGVTIGDDVFIAPCVVFTNDMYPRAFNDNWTITPTVINKGASLCANSTIRCGITIGEYAMVGAGSVVTKDVPPYALVVGNPARIVGKVNKMGKKTEI